MDKPRPRVMDITSAPRRPDTIQRRWQPTGRQIIMIAASLLLGLGLIAAAHWYQHRNDQVIMGDRYQVVYLLSGQVYFGKLQNTSGNYLTLKNVYTLQSESSADATVETSNETNILQVSRQVYGPEDSMAIRADQVQFWQNLRSDSKVTQAIDSVNK